jgi:hypothetical protein
MTSHHLNHAELLLAVVDTADLAAEKSAHIGSCPVCRSAREHLQERFQRLGRTARELAPAPTRPFRLPQPAPTTRWRFKPGWATGLAAALLLVMAVGRTMWLAYAPTPVPTAATLEADRHLSEAVDALVADALPLTFQYLASLDDREASEVDLQTDEAWIDWVVPPIEAKDDSLT